MTALVYALIRAGSDGWDDGRALAAFGLAAVLLTAFVAIERVVRQPVMPLWLLTGRDRAASYLVQLCLTAGMFGAFFFLTQYLQQVLHYGPPAPARRSCRWWECSSPSSGWRRA